MWAGALLGVLMFLGVFELAAEQNRLDREAYQNRTFTIIQK